MSWLRRPHRNSSGWLQEISKPYIAEQFGTDTVGNTVDDFGAIVCGIDVNSEWALAEWQIHDAHDGFGDCRDVCVGRRGSSKSVHDFLPERCSRTGFIGGKRLLIFRLTGMNEVVRSRGKRAWDDDRGFDAEPRQLAWRS